MAENNSFVERTENRLDENENPPLLGFNTIESKVNETNDMSVDADYKKLSSVSFTEKNKTDVSISLEKLSTIKNISFDGEYLENGDTSTNLVTNSLPESLNNNNFLNGTHESNVSFPDPNIFLVENSPCSSEIKNFNISSESNTNALIDTSFTGDEKIAECKQVNLASESDMNCHDSKVDALSASTPICSALSENVTCNDLFALDNRPLEECMPAQIFQFLEPANLIDISENKEVFPNMEENEGETFQDAVQFFKDPLQFLENMNTSEQVPSSMPRDSLYMTFDPLLKNFTRPPPTVQENPLSTVPSEVFLDSAGQKDKLENANPVNMETDAPPLVNKPLPDVSKRESFGNILLSFDSPMKSNSARSSQNIVTYSTHAPKLYTEEELQQAIKINELTIQESYLKKQKEMEEESVKKFEEKEKTIIMSSHLCKTLHNTVEELFSVLIQLKQENETISSRIEELETEKTKLDCDLKTSAEDLQSVEHTFSDFHKRYVQCKEMLKTYKDNEDCLKEQINSLNKRLEEQEQMYDMLQSKTEDIVEKANTEVANVKKGGDAQVAVLKAQLKKSELKISSLESDLKQVRIENDKLSGICDDLMAKVSET